MTRSDIEAKLKGLQERLRDQQHALLNARATIQQMELTVQQLTGACAVLQELLAETEPPEAPMA